MGSIFYLSNMTNNVVSESVSSSEQTPLSTEAQNRIDTISTIINNIVRESTDREKILLRLFNENLRRQITSNPGAVAVVLNDVEEKYQASLANKTGSEKYQANKDHIAYLEKIWNFINSCAQNIQWDNELNALAGSYDNKKTSLLATYANLITHDHPTQSA